MTIIKNRKFLSLSLEDNSDVVLTVESLLAKESSPEGISIVISTIFRESFAELSRIEESDGFIALIKVFIATRCCSLLISLYDEHLVPIITFSGTLASVQQFYVQNDC